MKQWNLVAFRKLQYHLAQIHFSRKTCILMCVLEVHKLWLPLLLGSQSLLLSTIVFNYMVLTKYQV